MTHKIIICILLLVTVSSGNNMASAGRTHVANAGTDMHISNSSSPAQQTTQNPHKLPLSAAHQNDAHHGKAMKVPHMEELPHIHRYHKERVKKLKAHHSKFWILSKMIVVICHLSLLWIAYMHLTH